MRQSTRLLALLVGVLGLLVVGLRVQRPLSQRELPAGSATGYRVDLNQADVAELALLPGVGPQLAQRIVERRREQGPFRSVAELDAISGVGAVTLRRIEPWVVCR